MRFRLLAFALVVGMLPLAAPAGEKKDNPFKTAKVGDYVAYKMTTSVGGKDFNIDMKQVVSAKDDKEVTLKTVTTFMGNQLPGQSTKIDLTMPYDPAAAAIQGNKKGKFEKTSEGKEKIKVGGKDYDCNFIAGKVVADVKGQKLESEVKLWFAKSVPLTGLVKMEVKSQLANVQMELSGSGNEK